MGVHDLRAFTHDRHRTVDDRPFGGGEGMVLKAEPLAEALASLGVNRRSRLFSSQRLEERQSPRRVRALARTSNQSRILGFSPRKRLRPPQPAPNRHLALRTGPPIHAGHRPRTRPPRPRGPHLRPLRRRRRAHQPALLRYGALHRRLRPERRRTGSGSRRGRNHAPDSRRAGQRGFRRIRELRRSRCRNHFRHRWRAALAAWSRWAAGLSALHAASGVWRAAAPQKS